MTQSFNAQGLGLNRRELLIAAGGIAAASLSGPAFAQAAKRGGTLRMSNGGDPPDFDVIQSATYLTQMACAPCYSTLLRIDPTDYSKLLPDLASKFEVSSDGKTVTFTLREGVQFHNGAILTSDDVVYSLDRIRKPPTGLVSPRKGLLGNIVSVEAADAKTVVVKLAQPQPDFPFLVSNPFNVIYCKAVAAPLDASGQGMKRTVVGTGPFKLSQAIDGQLYEYVRFDKYFGEAPYLEKIQSFPIKDEIARAVALQGKNIDACFFFANESVLTMLRKTPGITQLRRPTPTFVNLIPNIRLKPFDDPRVREALSLAIDRDSFIKTVGPLSGAFFHSLGLLLPDSPHSLTADEMKSFPGYDTIPGLGGNLAANREKAIALLAQAGVPKDFKIVMPTRADIPAFRDASINIAAQLKTVGLDVAVDVRDAGTFYELENHGQFQLIAHSVAVSGALPDQIFGEGYTSFGGRNYGGWKDDSIDDLFRQQSREIDPAKRNELLRQFQLAFLKTNYQINLAWVGYAAAYANNVKGWNALPDLYANMQQDKVWLDG